MTELCKYCHKVRPQPIMVQFDHGEELWSLTHVCPKHGKITTGYCDSKEDAIAKWNAMMEEERDED